MSYNRGIFIRRNTKPNIGSRQSGSQRARTHGLTKERANKPNILQLQVCFGDFLDFESAVSFQSQRTSSWSGSAWSMIRKSGSRFSEEIMLKQKRLARCRFNQNASRSIHRRHSDRANAMASHEEAVPRLVYSCHDGQTLNALVPIGVQECVVVPERYAAVGFAPRPERLPNRPMSVHGSWRVRTRRKPRPSASSSAPPG